MRLSFGQPVLLCSKKLEGMPEARLGRRAEGNARLPGLEELRRPEAGREHDTVPIRVRRARIC
jgi:hypothetical protein